MTPFLVLTLLGAVPLALGDASSKRGLIFIPDNDHPNDDNVWDSSSSDLTWYYNYGPSPSPNYANTKLEFVPMLWGNESDNSFLDTVSGLIDSGTNVTYALGFNEPDGVSNGGSGIAAEDAAATWIRLLEPLREKYHVKLGAPAVTGSPSGFTWLQNFFTACNGGCHPEFIPVHWYGNFDGFASHIGQVNATYMNMSMWVTEFAIADANLSDSQSFFNMSTQFLDRLAYVDRYSYFGGFRSSASNVGPDASMLDQNGQLTDIGSWYLGGSATGNVPKGMGSNVQANLSFVWTLFAILVLFWSAS
ncbi:glycoside hydrolase family 128 protein [Viridothelium virens]|uniref:Glycoside hydrolase family 128 protein n=1 Tax=Viridothelium virens TaxID=1048519 RepID=A0A6A6HGT7_VIRVR|nr:glycoside hydrolase family 128 protein [Viridothelium virens]